MRCTQVAALAASPTCTEPPPVAPPPRTHPTAHAVAQYILAQLDRPLLCSTAGGGGGGEDEGGEDGLMCPDAATLMDRYGRQVGGACA